MTLRSRASVADATSGVLQRPHKLSGSRPSTAQGESGSALVICGGKLALEPGYAPATGDNLLIRMNCGAIASPDLAVSRGFVAHEGVVGHMGAGVVSQVAASSNPNSGDAAPVRAGTRVVVWPHVVCTTCEYCKAGLSTHCPQRTVMGLHKRAGLFAQLVRVPQRNVVSLPDGVDDERAALAPLAASALSTAGLVRVEGKPFVTVLGDGPMGLLVAQLLARRNASVRLLGTHVQRMTTCEKWGVKHRHISDVGTHRDQHMVFDCTGSSLGTRLAMQIVRPRGTIVIKSWPLPVAASAVKHDRLNLSVALSGEATIIGSGPGNITHLHEAVEALASRAIDVEPLITRRFALGQFDAAYTQAGMQDAACIVLDLRT